MGEDQDAASLPVNGPEVRDCVMEIFRQQSSIKRLLFMIKLLPASEDQ